MFGSTLSENVRRYGNPIPPTILCAIQHLHDNGEIEEVPVMWSTIICHHSLLHDASFSL